MLYASKIGPVESAEGTFDVYLAVTEEGILEPVLGAPPGEAMEALARRGQGHELKCAPELALAGRKAGFDAGEAPEHVRAAVAACATFFAVGVGAQRLGPVAPLALMKEGALFWRAAPWRRFHDGVVLAVEARAGGRVRKYEGVVMGAGGQEFGVALYEKPGSAALLRQFGDVLGVEAAALLAGLAVTLDDEPAYAARAAEAWCGVGRVPFPMKVAAGGGAIPNEREAFVLAAALKAVAELAAGADEGAASYDADGVKVAVRVRVASDPEPRAPTPRRKGQRKGARSGR